MQLTLILGSALTALISTAHGASCPGVPAAKYPFSVASGWTANVVASGLTKPRDLVFDSQGRLLIVQSGVGISQHVLDSTGCITSSKVLIRNPSLNHGIRFSIDGNTLFASMATTVYSWSYRTSDGSVSATSKVIVSGMGNSDHVTRTLIIPANHPNLLVVSHGSNSNLDEGSINATVARAIVKVFDMNQTPSGGYNFVTQGWNAGYGLRNEVALAFDANNMLWGVENSADDLTRTPETGGAKYSVVTDNPAEELNFLGDVSVPNNKWYGYPRCFTVGKPSAFTDASFQVGDQFVQVPTTGFNDSTCAAQSTPPRLSLPAHTAPLGAKFDATYSNMFVTLHGSWDRTPPQGYRLIAIPFKSGPNGYEPVAASNNPLGFSNIFFSPSESSCSSSRCARPVGVVFDKSGRLYMTSDASGEVFVLSKTVTTSAPYGSKH